MDDEDEERSRVGPFPVCEVVFPCDRSSRALRPTGIDAVTMPLPRATLLTTILLAGLAVGAVAPGRSSAAPIAPLPWSESFDDCRDGVVNALQWQSGVRLAFRGSLRHWDHVGSHAVHVAERGGSAGRAVLLWQEDRLTLRGALEANAAGAAYRLSCDVAPAVYASPDQATGPEDGIVVEVCRDDGGVVASGTFRPGPWQGRLLFRRVSLVWTGDGGGPVHLVIRPARREGRFAGAIDRLLVERVGDAATAGTFAAHVGPLLEARCVSCHRGDGAAGGLDLSSASGLAAGGEGGRALVPGDREASLLWQRVVAGEMPPDAPLDVGETAALGEWIDGGAEWVGEPLDPFARSTARRAGADWWSLAPLAAPAPPHLPPGDEAWAVNDIDRFVLAELRAAGLAPAPRAEPRVLVRRLWIDATGLPPDPETVREFERDPSEEAWAALVERVLVSEDHAERMARHWLDVVRYGESDGYEYNGPRPHAWPYRDWVIRAFHDDLPWDAFVRHQIAGDVLAPDTLDGVAATGFLVAGVHNAVAGAGAAMRETVRQDHLEEMAGTVSQTFLGLSANCARCHDHKYDPVPIEEYYAFAAALAGVRHGTRSVAGPDGGPIEVYAAVSGPVDAVHVLSRGDVRKPAAEVVPAGLRAIAGDGAEFGIGPGAPDGERRRLLAEWLATTAEAPLSRVIVNRVWQWHFGRGIVDTPGDLGFNGGRPSHPLLLEWLAARFRADGMSLRALERTILLSNTWRMASDGTADGERVDRDNRRLWRQNPRRVEAEVFRDALLACAGLLPGKRGGPGYRDVVVREVPPTHYYDPVDSDDDGGPRRTIYRFSPRGSRSGLLDTFDCPDPSARTQARSVTTTPGQVLSQWNDAFVLRMAEAFARRVEEDVDRSGGPGDRGIRIVDRAWWLALGRPPDDVERTAALDLLGRHGPSALCRVLVNTNEFVVVP